MQKLAVKDLYSLEEYARIRTEFRLRAMAHKKLRIVAIGAHASVHFEDRLSMQYQVQEVLRVERIFEPDSITEELAAYNPLIPDGHNWKATLMVEYEDVAERHEALKFLIGIETRAWVGVEGYDRVFAIADEDMERTNAEKTSAVHFLRFELTAAMIASLRHGSALSVGLDHPRYQYTQKVPQDTLESLIKDLE